MSSDLHHTSFKLETLAAYGKFALSEKQNVYEAGTKKIFDNLGTTLCKRA
jgi:hypothetical protein